MKKTKLFVMSLIAGACISAAALANDDGFPPEYVDCLGYCQGSCSLSGMCYWEMR